MCWCTCVYYAHTQENVLTLKKFPLNLSWYCYKQGLWLQVFWERSKSIVSTEFWFSIDSQFLWSVFLWSKGRWASNFSDLLCPQLGWALPWSLSAKMRLCALLWSSLSLWFLGTFYFWREKLKKHHWTGLSLSVQRAKRLMGTFRKEQGGPHSVILLAFCQFAFKQ